MSAEAETLRARVAELEATLKNLLYANDAYYRLPADYNDFKKRKITLNRAVERSRAALTTPLDPAPQPAAPLSAFAIVHAAVISDNPTPADWATFEALKQRSLSDAQKIGRDDRSGK